MEIKNIESQIQWIVECDNLSYVRYLWIRDGNQYISWKRNFDQTEEIMSKILDDKELEKRFSEINNSK